jgi:hypothetical protein
MVLRTHEIPTVRRKKSKKTRKECGCLINIAKAAVSNVLKLVKMNSTEQTVLHKLTATQLVKKVHAFYGTRRLITVFTKARH